MERVRAREREQVNRNGEVREVGGADLQRIKVVKDVKERAEEE